MNTTLNLILVLDVPPHSYFHSLLCMIGGHSQAQNVDGWWMRLKQMKRTMSVAAVLHCIIS